jgi:Protein of unknown function (DUF1552)
MRAHQPTKRLPRRAFLGGSAVAIGLPFLASLAPRKARAQLAGTSVRLIYIFLPNGLDMGTFRPTTTGADYVTPPMLVPLEPHKSDFSVITGLENFSGWPDGPGDHAAGTSAFITCSHAFKSETTIRSGVSADQVAAQALGGQTRLPSLQLGIEGGLGSGNCDNGYSCTYARNISWANASTPLPKITSPAQAFNQLFEGFDPAASAADITRRQLYDASVLDHAVGEVSSLSSKLGQSDRIKLDQYLSGVRQLERRLTGVAPGLACAPGQPPPGGIEADFPSHVQAMNDLMVLALSCDATRYISLMFGNASSSRTFPFLGIVAGHHDISHHRNNPVNIAQLQQIGRWEMEQLAYLLARMKEVPDGAEGETLLHNSAVFVSSDVSDGSRHNHDDLPVILAGNGGGAFTPGRHIAYPPNNVGKEPLANLFVSMLNAAGVAGATLGDSTGPLVDV